MAPKLDFQSVMDELTVFQNALGKIHASLNNARNKEVLGAAIEDLQNARAQVEIEYPKADALLTATARKVLAEAEQAKVEAEKERAEVEQRIAASKAAQNEKLAPPPKPVAKIDPALGQTLRVDLLQRFGPQNGKDASAAGRIREAWQDWD